MIDLRTIRTDVVGSLLRPAAVIEARKRFDEGKLDAAGLRAIEDDAVRAAVQLQESIGLDVITDGEMRRLNFQDSFGAAVEGFDARSSTLHAYTRRVEGGTRAAALGGSASGEGHRDFAPAAGQVAAEACAQCAAGGVRIRCRRGEDAGQGRADRPGPHLPAIRP